MRILHTSDWHLGSRLCGQDREHEFRALLDWLADTVEDQGVDCLLVCGDVFDSPLPSHAAQALYYRFLARLALSGRCGHVVIVAGNHDAPALLEAPRALLAALNVHVMGRGAPDPADEVLLLRDGQGNPELLVCAVPYLRDQDIRHAGRDQGGQDRDALLRQGIAAHYQAVFQAALALRQEHGPDLPVAAMGHLFVAGCALGRDDGARDLYIGGLGQVGADIFPPWVGYVALGHLHRCQQVGGHPCRRYSGAPLALGFGEAGAARHVLLADLETDGCQVRPLEVPCFQPLARVRGGLEAIMARLEALAADQDPDGPSLWVEVVLDQGRIVPDLRQRIEAALAGRPVDLLRLKALTPDLDLAATSGTRVDLDDLDEFQVFEHCLRQARVPDWQARQLRRAYQEAVAGLRATEGDHAHP